ncbi:MAG: alpha/beta hydrolase [Planctomycetes bacterium]|nr:alpha/beta hydrolase [Planctomycetota bacterium]
MKGDARGLCVGPAAPGGIVAGVPNASTTRPRLILLPGLDGSGRLFAPLLAALGTGIEARAIAYPADRALGYAELADLLRPQLPADRPFMLLGESFSGPLAIRLAAERPPGLVGLVLCCTFARNPRPWLGALARPLLGLLPLRLLPVAPACLALAGRDSNAHWRAELKAALAPQSSAVLRARLRAVLAVDVRSEAAAVEVPVLALRAARDLIVPPAASRALMECLPRATSIDLEGPHFLLQVASHAAAEVVARFVADPVKFDGPQRRS